MLRRAPEAFCEASISHFAGLAQLIGLPKSIGQIYGLLYGSAVPLSFTDIVEQLNISKGSASQGLNALREVGAIVSVSSSGERRERFTPETELRKLVSGFLQGAISDHLRVGGEKLRMLEERYGESLAGHGAEGRLLLGRLHKLQSWHRKGGAVLPLLARFLS